MNSEISFSSSKFGVSDNTGRKSFMPKAFHIVAQGRRAAAHPGSRAPKTSTLKGLNQLRTIKNRLENTTFPLGEPLRGIHFTENLLSEGIAGTQLDGVAANANSLNVFRLDLLCADFGKLL